MYIMSIGGAPTGEAYITPPNKNGEFGLYIKYYNGGSVKVLSFKKPTKSPDDISPVGRLDKLEVRQQDSYNLMDAVKELYGKIESYQEQRESWVRGVLQAIANDSGTDITGYLSTEPLASVLLKPDFDKFDEEGKIADNLAELETIIGEQASYYPTKESYVCTNFDPLTGTR